jgi:hypothetical protein
MGTPKVIACAAHILREHGPGHEGVPRALQTVLLTIGAPACPLDARTVRALALVLNEGISIFLSLVRWFHLERKRKGHGVRHQRKRVDTFGLVGLDVGPSLLPHGHLEVFGEVLPRAVIRALWDDAITQAWECALAGEIVPDSAPVAPEVFAAIYTSGSFADRQILTLDDEAETTIARETGYLKKPFVTSVAAEVDQDRAAIIEAALVGIHRTRMVGAIRGWRGKQLPSDLDELVAAQARAHAAEVIVLEPEAVQDVATSLAIAAHMAVEFVLAVTALVLGIRLPGPEAVPVRTPGARDHAPCRGEQVPLDVVWSRGPPARRRHTGASGGSLRLFRAGTVARDPSTREASCPMFRTISAAMILARATSGPRRPTPRRGNHGPRATSGRRPSRRARSPRTFVRSGLRIVRRSRRRSRAVRSYSTTWPPSPWFTRSAEDSASCSWARPGRENRPLRVRSPVH